MTASEIRRLRLGRQFLATTEFRRGSQVVRALGAVQAQDYSGAKWALSQRTHGATDDEIEGEFNDGGILRTHVLRPTWHFVAPTDIRWMLDLTGPRVSARMAPYNRHLELDEKVFRRTNAAITRALERGGHRTRIELREALLRLRIGPITTQRLAHIVMRAELDGIVCSGPRRGRQFTYALLDERAPKAQLRDRDEGLLALTRLYFRTRGPATAQDFSWWSGLTAADVRRGIDMAGRRLEQRLIDGRLFWQERSPELRARVGPTAHLLPNYDEYFIGYRDRSAVGGTLTRDWVGSRASTLAAHVVFVNGQIAGGWKYRIASDRVEIRLNLLTRLTATEQKRVARQAGRFGRFLGRSAAETQTAVRIRDVRPGSG